MSRSIDTAKSAYAVPSPEAVARLLASHGIDAVLERWSHATGARTLYALARRGGAGGRRSSRSRCTDPLTELAAIETAFIFSSTRSGERAAGVRSCGLLGAMNERQLTWPKITATARGQLSRIAAAAARGDADAVAEMKERHAHERAVFGVLLAALALVTDQTATGRPRLPEPSDALREALAGHDTDAVEAVFPGLLKESERNR